jgi:hypothetical protein
MKHITEIFPKEILDKMLYHQEQQGNKRDIEVFNNSRITSKLHGGFTWADTDEGLDFWGAVIEDKNFEVFFEKYPKPEYPKWMMVWQQGERSVKRQVIGKVANWYVAMPNGLSIEDASSLTIPQCWQYAEDINESKVFGISIKEIAAMFNIDSSLVKN